jgi:hypothetical protein
MLKDREKFGRVLAGMLTRNERLGEADVTGAISRTMTAYALGLSFVMLIMAGATTLSLMVLRIDYYYVLGPIAGVAVLLPYVGVILSTVPAVAVTFIQYEARGPAGLPRVQPHAVPGGQRADALHRRRQGPAFPADRNDRFHLLGHDLPQEPSAVPLTSAIKVVCEHVKGWEGLARLLGEPDLPHYNKKRGSEKPAEAAG